MATLIDQRWQERPADRAAVAIKNGLESKFEGSVSCLVATAKALTLLTEEGAEVQLAAKRALDDDLWEGEVLRAAKSPDAPQVGSIVRFRLANVLGGTL